MQYLVKGTFIDPGALLPAEQLAKMIENVVFPSLEKLAKFESERKVVAGGLLVGDRAAAFIVEAKDNLEVDSILHELPFWGLVKWEVAALQPFKSRIATDKKLLDQMKVLVA